MQSMTVATDAERRMRMRDLDLLEQQEAKEREEARKNSNFTQIYPMG